MKDYYKILGVPEDASEEEIRARWVELTKQYHPDLKGGEGDEKMREINEAYEVLKDYSKRLEHDLQRALKKSLVKKAQSRKGIHLKRISISLSVLILLTVLCVTLYQWLFLPKAPKEITYPIAKFTETEPPPPIEKKEAPSPILIERKEAKEPNPKATPLIEAPIKKEAFLPPVQVERPLEDSKKNFKEMMVENFKEVPKENLKEVIKEPPKEALREVPKKPSEEPPKMILKEEAKEIQKETPKELPKGMEKETPKEIPKEASKEIPMETLKEAPKEIPKETRETRETKETKETRETRKTREAPLAAKEEEIEQFFQRYIDFYVKRDIEGFLSLFSSKAIQNQRDRFEAIRKIYADFFNQSKELQYRIEETKTEILPEHVRVSARYRVNQVLKKDNRERVWEGSIQWTLEREEGGLKIVTLDYQHEKSP